MFVDRYEIHIQAFGNVFDGKMIMLRSPASHIYIQYILISRKTNNMQKHVSTPLENRTFANYQILRYEKYVLKMSPYFLYSLKHFWYNKMDKYGGSRASKIHKSSTCQVLMCRIMESGFYYTNPKRGKSLKPLNLFPK